MTVLQPIKLTCPVCLAEFQSQQVTSTNSFGGKRTDFHERAAGTQPLPFLVHTCATCGYSGAKQDFDTEVDSFSKVYIRHKYVARQAPLTGSEKYELAAKTAIVMEREPRRIADFWLKAAWCCVDEGDVEAERYYRRKAVEVYTAALDAYDGVDPAERPVLTYLVGELWRRIGDVRQAEEWFDRAIATVECPEHKWIADAAKQQRDYPREWFG